MIECSEPLVDFDFTENEIESVLSEFQNRQNVLQERFISLKALTETLKGQILNEKNQWRKELKETVNMEKKIKENHRVSTESLAFADDGYQSRLKLFKDFLFFSQTSSKLRETLERNNYQQWLSEIEEESNAELDKIRRSMAALKPLQEMASAWENDKRQKDDDNSETVGDDDCYAGMLADSQNSSPNCADMVERFSLISSD